MKSLTRLSLAVMVSVIAAGGCTGVSPKTQSSKPHAAQSAASTGPTAESCLNKATLVQGAWLEHPSVSCADAVIRVRTIGDDPNKRPTYEIAADGKVWKAYDPYAANAPVRLFSTFGRPCEGCEQQWLVSITPIGQAIAVLAICRIDKGQPEGCGWLANPEAKSFTTSLLYANVEQLIKIYIGKKV